KRALKDSVTELLEPLERRLDTSRARPFTVMIAGVNGSGKTTSIGKLAKWLQSQGKSVVLAAGDTFRAAAREQLVVWGERNNVPVIAQAGGDPGAVVFDALNAARARGADVVIADTAGRLPTQLHLMEEIRKVKRVAAKAQADAPHEVLLVLDANAGQNALAQVKAFDEALGLTGLVLTKLDGTAKGGVVCAIARERRRAQALGDSLFAAQSRPRVPGPEAALRPLGVRQRHAAARFLGACAQGSGAPGARRARQGRPAGARKGEPGPALRRRAAAPRDCARGGEPAVDPARR